MNSGIDDGWSDFLWCRFMSSVREWIISAIRLARFRRLVANSTRRAGFAEIELSMAAPSTEAVVEKDGPAFLADVEATACRAARGRDARRGR